MLKNLKFIDLFAGVGGLSLPFRQLKMKCVFSSEWDKYCQQTYRLNFHEQIHGDINKIKPDQIPDFELLLAGFPCQPFSIAGLRKGFDDQRGNLFFKLYDIIKVKRPRFFILENVRNLISHDKGSTFKVILNKLKEINYFIKYKVLNTKNFNIPQNRERIYIIGFRNYADYLNFEFPKPQNCSKSLDDMKKFIDLENQQDHKYYYEKSKYHPWLLKAKQDHFTFYQIRRTYIRVNQNGLCPTLTANMGTGGHNVPIIFTKHGFRKLLPRECFNLQGFPKEFLLPEIANTQLYKQAGNAVTVHIAKALAIKIQVIWKNDYHKSNIQQNHQALSKMIRT